MTPEHAATSAAAAAVVDTPAHRMWPSPLVCEYLDGTTWRLRFPFHFVSPSPADFPSVELPIGEETDFASLPRFFWRVMHPTHPQIGKAGVVHDHYYRTPSCAVTREGADNALRAGMEALGAPRWKRVIVFRAVRMFGGGAFHARRTP